MTPPRDLGSGQDLILVGGGLASSHYVLSPVPHLGAADIDWSVQGPLYREKIIDYLEERYIPNLRRDLVTTRIFTPADFKDELNAHPGAGIPSVVGSAKATAGLMLADAGHAA